MLFDSNPNQGFNETPIRSLTNQYKPSWKGVCVCLESGFTGKSHEEQHVLDSFNGEEVRTDSIYCDRILHRNYLPCGNGHVVVPTP